MSPFTDIRLLDVAPLLPVSVALTYVAFIVFDWERALGRRFTGTKAHTDKDPKTLLPVEVAHSKPQKSSTWVSHIISAAVPMAHYSITSPKLWTMDRSERISLNVCLGQIAILMVEFVTHYVRYHDWKTSRLLTLGSAWGLMALRSLSLLPGTKFTSITTSACIAILGVVSILPESLPATQVSSKQSIPDAIRSEETDPWEAKVTRSKSLLVAFHMFSVSLLLVYVLHDYPSLSHQLLYQLPWLSSMSHYSPVLALLLLRDGVSNWQATYQEEQTLAQHIRMFLVHIYKGVPDSVRSGVLIPLSVAGPWLICFFLANYMTSCLGFRRLILNEPRTRPKFLDGGIFGGIMYQMLVLAQFYLRREAIGYESKHKIFHFLMAFASAIGQTTMTVVVVAGGLWTWKYLL